LDELFGLSDYELAWSSLAGYLKLYEGEKKAYEKDPDVLGVERFGGEYNRAVEEFSVAEVELQNAQEKLASAKKALEEADVRLRKLEEVRTSIERLKLKEAQIQANLSNTEETLATLVENAREKEGDIQKLKQRLASMETKIGSCRAELKDLGFAPEQPLEMLKQYLATLNDRIYNLKGEHEAALRSIRENQNRLSSLQAESLCPLCFQALAEDYKRSLVERIHEENGLEQSHADGLQREIEEAKQTKSKADFVSSQLQDLVSRVDELRSRVSKESEASVDVSRDFEVKQDAERSLRERLRVVRGEIVKLDMSELESAKARRNDTVERFYRAESELTAGENRKRDLVKRVDELKERIDLAQQKIERMGNIARIIDFVEGFRGAYRDIQPRLRREFVEVLRDFVQQVLDSLVGGEGSLLNVLIDETYTPFVKSDVGAEREVAHLSGGERTLLAFAYRLGLGQLIMQSRTGHGLSMLLLDEPTESLGSEDGSIERLAEAISRLKAIEQIIAVTHSEGFAEKADHVVRLEKEAGTSKVTVER
jgi:exonuclease SbcC